MQSLLTASRRGAWLLAALTIFSSTIATAALPQHVGSTPVPSLAPMVEKTTPAVVNIATEGRVQLRTNPLYNDPFFRRFFNLPDAPRERRTQGLGSGVIVDAKRGLVLTNNHVIADAQEITVKLTDGRNLAAEVVGTDPETDIAVLKIEATNLTAIPLADSERLRVGDFVVAIGNPFGIGQTVTSGIVSGLARSGLGITGYEDLIQTDASINPGNSGGALVNLNGELVGINTAIYSQSGGNIGIGFAIPINMASQVMEQLVEYGDVSRGFLGAQLQDLTPDLAAAFGLDDHAGAVLVEIVEGSPAEAAGLQAGDVVTALNDKPVRNAADLRNRVGLMRVGEKVSLRVLRDGKDKMVAAKVGKRELAQNTPQVGNNKRLSGATFGDIPRESPLFGRIDGVVVFEVTPGTPVWEAGIRQGDIITSVNRTSVKNLRQFLDIVVKIEGSLLFGVQRGNQAAFVVIK